MTILFWRKHDQPGNASGRNAVLAGGANAAAALVAANATSPDGESVAKADWGQTTIDASGTLATPIWFQGNAVEGVQVSRRK